MERSECGCTHHPGKTHDEYMDAYDRKENRELITRSLARIKAATSYGELVSARAALRAGIENEIRRLQEKERLMKAGRIRCVTSKSAK